MYKSLDICFYLREDVMEHTKHLEIMDIRNSSKCELLSKEMGVFIYHANLVRKCISKEVFFSSNANVRLSWENGTLIDTGRGALFRYSLHAYMC